MKATLKIEAIGDNSYQMMRSYCSIANSASSGMGALLASPEPPYWVAIVYDKTPTGYLKNLLPGKKDYVKSNSVGSRGVFIWYILLSGYVYEVSAPVSWKRTKHYFCTVTDDGDIVEISREDVDEWIKQNVDLE